MIEHLYGDDDARDANAVEAAITRLRKKLGPDAIETRRGFGYSIPDKRIMSIGSLRLRLLVAGGLSVILALLISATGLIFLFERHVERRVDAELTVHLNQLVAGLDRNAAGEIELVQAPAEVRFDRPMSGLYWQIVIEFLRHGVAVALLVGHGACAAGRTRRRVGPSPSAGGPRWRDALLAGAPL